MQGILNSIGRGFFRIGHSKDDQRVHPHHRCHLVHLAQRGNLQAALKCTDVSPARASIEFFLITPRQFTRLFERKCKVVLGLLIGAFIGIAWLCAFMILGNWRTFPLALIVAVVYFVLNVAVLAPVFGDFIAARWVLAFVFTTWGFAVVNQQIDQVQEAGMGDSTRHV